MRKLGNSPDNETSSSGFKIQSHVNNNLSSVESANQIATFFSKISNEFTPISLHCLPSNVRDFLTQTSCEDTIPILGEYDVYTKMKRQNKPNSFVEGDLPPKLMKRFYIELVTPATNIFNTISCHGTYPDQWKI